MAIQRIRQGTTTVAEYRCFLQYPRCSHSLDRSKYQQAQAQEGHQNKMHGNKKEPSGIASDGANTQPLCDYVANQQ